MRYFLLFITLVLSAACSSKSNILVVNGEKICVPSSNVIRFDLSGFPKGNYDDQGGGLDFSIEFSGKEMQEHIPNFKKRIQVDNSFYNGFLLINMTGLEKIHRMPKPPIGDLKPLKEAPTLFRNKPIAFGTHIAEKASTGYIYWGTCSMDLSHQQSFDCVRQLTFKEIMLEYDIHKQNLHLYKDIDQFIQRKFQSWRCKS